MNVGIPEYVSTLHYVLFLLSSSVYSLLFMAGFESRQPSHVLVANYPYGPLEDRYIYPHSLRNMGEQPAQWANAYLRWHGFNLRGVFSFRWAVCQHHACPQRDKPVQSGGAAGSPVETVQQRGDPGVSEQSRKLCFSHFLLHLFDLHLTVSKQNMSSLMAWGNFWFIKGETEKTRSPPTFLLFSFDDWRLLPIES